MEGEYRPMEMSKFQMDKSAWEDKLLINIWYYMLYKYVLYKKINLKYIYQLKLSKINLKILLK